MLLIAQSAQQTGVLQVHRPEVCYPTGGYRLSPVTQHAVPVGSSTLQTNSLVATGGGVTESIIYWTRVGDSQPLSWSQQRIDVARQNLRGVIPDAILVRVSIRQGDHEGARNTLGEFVHELLAAIPSDKRAVFIA
jgi:EpsI family protein